MNKKLKEKIRESISSVLPITAIVLILSLTITPMPVGTMMLFLSGAAMLIVGMGFFSLGADMSMMPMGEGIGGELTKSRKLPIILIVSFLIGTFVTIAEPDLQVLAHQVPSVPDAALIWVVAIGVGALLLISMLRTLYNIPLSKMLVIFYAVIFLMTFFIPKGFIAVAFDSGGVTTGPITVPFIMALGIGVASIRSDNNAHDDSFGFVALCSVGPILAVLILGICYKATTGSYTPFEIPDVVDTAQVGGLFLEGLYDYLKEVGFALLPIMVFFILFQLITKRFEKRNVIRIFIGALYTFIGLVLFLTGVNVGFMSAGSFIGSTIAGKPYRWILIPIGMVIGYFVVDAEPAVAVLNKQVEEISEGAISQKAMKISLSVGVACSVGLSMLRVLTGISIYWCLVPGYAIAIAMTFFVPKIYTAVAFDSGGVASGPMTATFLLPLAMGACEAMGGDVLMDAFGIVAMVAMTPLITIQMLGLIYKRKISEVSQEEEKEIVEIIDDESDEIIEYPEVYKDEGSLS